MTDHCVNHVTFTIERRYPASPAKVFGAWADAAAKEIWLDDPDYKSDEGTDYELDFRVGGHERFGGLTPEGTRYSYEMYSGDDRMSVSLTTVEIVPDQDGTKLTYTEQGAFLDGIDEPGHREEGTAWLLDNLGKYLTAPVGR